MHETAMLSAEQAKVNFKIPAESEGLKTLKKNLKNRAETHGSAAKHER